MLIKMLLMGLFFLAPTPGLAEPVPLKIGVVIPLSGGLAYVGQDIERGMHLAQRDFPHEAGLLFTPLFPHEAGLLFTPL